MTEPFRCGHWLPRQIPYPFSHLYLPNFRNVPMCPLITLPSCIISLIFSFPAFFSFMTKGHCFNFLWILNILTLLLYLLTSKMFVSWLTVGGYFFVISLSSVMFLRFFLKTSALAYKIGAFDLMTLPPSWR